MEKILIVEDNKSLAKLIAKKISSITKTEVDTAFSFQEAKLFLEKNNYFITLLDVNLPDAPNGEVIDYAIKKEQHIIVLSGNIDEEFRKSMLQKSIIDYVNKGGIEDIEYIGQIIQRLKKNKDHTILVVEDSLVTRQQVQFFLENMYFNVIAVAHGEEALGILNVKDNISLVLTDYKMPVMNGLELTREIRKKYPKNILSIIGLSGSEYESTIAMFLKSGANDYVKKPYSKEELSCRVNNAIEALENVKIISDYEINFSDL